MRRNALFRLLATPATPRGSATTDVLGAQRDTDPPPLVTSWSTSLETAWRSPARTLAAIRASVARVPFWWTAARDERQTLWRVALSAGMTRCANKSSVSNSSTLSAFGLECRWRIGQHHRYELETPQDGIEGPADGGTMLM